MPVSWFSYSSHPWLKIAGWSLLSLLAAVVAVPLLIRVVVSVSKRTPAPWTPALGLRLRSPLIATLTAAALLGAWPWIGAGNATGVAEFHQELRGLLLVGAFWTLARVVSVVAIATSHSRWAESKPHLVPLSEFTARVLRVSVFFVGVITVLGEFGFPIASLLAGLGVGGIAVALAAQKTMENLFGSVSILADAPFRVGDRIVFDSANGVVVSIGLRSTRLRTDDNRLVIMPNGKLADLLIQNLTALTRESSRPDTSKGGAPSTAPKS